MSGIPVYPLQVFFDGSCSVCAAKMELIRRKDHAGRLHFVDISLPGFDPSPYGITLAAFMHEMHAIDRKNQVYRGVEAFRVIWQAFPASTWYGLLGTLATLPGVNILARSAYWCFARFRIFLPKNRAACEDGSCRLGKDNRSK
jgi:predicted DCC family thiol-disulfide oxidoreductase YuxK